LLVWMALHVQKWHISSLPLCDCTQFMQAASKRQNIGSAIASFVLRGLTLARSVQQGSWGGPRKSGGGENAE
jgi:hypothetical protein